MVENKRDHEKIRKLLVNGGGVTLFLKCREKFPQNTALTDKMLGCFSEVIQDENLQPKMMTHDFAQQIIAIVDTPDFTDLGLGAFEILGHMLKNGKHSWRKTKLSFTETLAKVDTIYARWDISRVKTSYGTDIESILPFLTSDFPQLRLHGLWTIACNTRQNNSTCIRIDRLRSSSVNFVTRYS